MRYLALCLWLLVPIALWGGVTLYGSPHVIISYQFLDNGRVYDPRKPRIYTRCHYLGWQGWRRVAAEQGRCPWVRFFPLASGQ